MIEEWYWIKDWEIAHMSQDKPVLREFLEKWMNSGLLQSYESREKFRKEANELYLSLSALDRQGWISMPPEPTLIMFKAFHSGVYPQSEEEFRQFCAHYNSLLAAAPQINEPPQVEDARTGTSGGVDAGPASDSPYSQLRERLEFIANETHKVIPEEIEEVCDKAAQAIRALEAEREGYRRQVIAGVYDSASVGITLINSERLAALQSELDKVRGLLREVIKDGNEATWSLGTDLVERIDSAIKQESAWKDSTPGL
jgi:putative lipoic acid-binding regulatory protein